MQIEGIPGTYHTHTKDPCMYMNLKRKSYTFTTMSAIEIAKILYDNNVPFQIICCYTFKFEQRVKKINVNMKYANHLNDSRCQHNWNIWNISLKL